VSDNPETTSSAPAPSKLGSLSARSEKADKAKATKKKQSVAEVQKELRDLSKPTERPPVDMKKIYLRVGGVLAVVWIAAGIFHNKIGFGIAGATTAATAGVLYWLTNYFAKAQKLGALLSSADTDEGRKKALETLSTDFKKGDSQAILAKAQLQMQDSPREALATLEAVDLDKQLAPVAAQVRAMRAMIHLTFGEVKEARALADKLELGKQQEPKTRAMFAAVASEAWARTGEGQKAVDTLDLFNPEDPDMAEMKAQIWRARAFAYAATNDMKGAGRALRKLSEINPHLLGMFVGQKRIHPMLEKEAKNIVMKMGVVPRKVVRQRM
jgi:tetratricopeptide (TPR) repeat protein